MRTPIRVRELIAQEVDAVKRLAHSRTEPARRLERAKIVWLSHEGKLVPAIAEELHPVAKTVRAGLKRLNAQRLARLEDVARSDRPTTYTAKEEEATNADLKKRMFRYRVVRGDPNGLARSGW